MEAKSKKRSASKKAQKPQMKLRDLKATKDAKGGVAHILCTGGHIKP
jgi:hypothetical protein